MSRDDSVLYTAISSASITSRRAARLKEQKQEAKDERIEKAQQLKPSAKIIIDVIAQEKALITQELASLPMNVSTTEENVKELLMAYQRNLHFINRLQNKLLTALKEVK